LERPLNPKLWSVALRFRNSELPRFLPFCKVFPISRKANSMAVFLVTYDLVKEKSGFDYKPLTDELKKQGGVRSHLSEWLISLDNTPQQVFDHFNQFIDKNDRLMVNRISERPTWNIGLKGTREFIDKHFPI
jgi:hypothetical protein